jgi:hypothetical protein
MDWIVSLLAGVGLAAASGFRVFVPLLGVGLAGRAGFLPLTPGFEWLSSPVALGALAVATLLEVGAYFVPWIDNALDTVATPTAVGAGTVAALSVIGDSSPFVAWVLAILAGGGTAGLVQVGTVGARATSSVGTGGLTNPVLAFGELVASVGLTALSLLLPVLAGLFVLGLLYWALRRLNRAKGGRVPSSPG